MTKGYGEISSFKYCSLLITPRPRCEHTYGSLFRETKKKNNKQKNTKHKQINKQTIQ